VCVYVCVTNARLRCVSRPQPPRARRARPLQWRRCAACGAVRQWQGERGRACMAVQAESARAALHAGRLRYCEEGARRACVLVEHCEAAHRVSFCCCLACSCGRDPCGGARARGHTSRKGAA
jgi:hypothetical protein